MQNDRHIAPSAVISRREGLIEAAVGEELVALHIDNGACYGFNITAAHIWKLLQQPTSLLQLKDLLLRRFDVEPATCERELLGVVKQLEDEGLVEIIQAAPTAAP